MMALAKYLPEPGQRLRLRPPPACLYRDCVPMIETEEDVRDVVSFIATYVALAERCARDLQTVTGPTGPLDQWTCDQIVHECLFWTRIAQGMFDEEIADRDEMEEDLADVVATLRQVAELREKHPKSGGDLLTLLHQSLTVS